MTEPRIPPKGEAVTAQVINRVRLGYDVTVQVRSLETERHLDKARHPELRLMFIAWSHLTMKLLEADLELHQEVDTLIEAYNERPEPEPPEL